MTDILTGKEDIKRLFTYVEALTRESRKALTLEFNQKHKGIPFAKVPQTLSQSMVDWFAHRDKNVKVVYESTTEARNGTVRMVFNGEVKRVRFKMRLDATFSMTGQTTESPSYLKDLNVTVDNRDFSSQN